ncbi:MULTISPECIES: hypothetical protein [Aequorivita]|uniref:DUF2178 domain-containing protein n=2 Tax=Aequorivita TaxID=153265 RepID=A0AB35YQ29_9FLAO|nr:hypothetical protein [Aequorivita sp. Ant34-E75]WGF93293.1 hypothetical protein QCQ61_03670 [Aequorivita sp. Ant34-E75]
MDAKQNTWKVTNRNNIKQLAYWTGGWVIAMAVASFGQKFFWEGNTVLTLIFIFIATVVGIGMIIMNRKYINNLDEMQRKIHVEAMAISLGIGVVGGLSYSLLDQAKIISINAEIADVVILIGITYLVATFVGLNRYK